MTVRLNELRNAVDRLREALQASETSLNRDAAIQRFEFCFELAWRAIQEIAREEGMDCSSPKGCLKLAFKTNWIAGEGSWLAMLNDRNLTVHTYGEALAKEVYSRLPEYLPLFEQLLASLGKVSPGGNLLS